MKDLINVDVVVVEYYIATSEIIALVSRLSYQNIYFCKHLETGKIKPGGKTRKKYEKNEIQNALMS